MASPPVSSDTAFQFEGRNVRLVEQDGETWFVAADVARELGYGLASDLIKNLDADEKGMCPVHTLGGGQEMSIISEAGVYRAIVQRKLNKRQHNPGLHEKVSRFQRFVFHDVLPQIRQTGAYNPAPIAPALPGSYAAALRELAAAVETVEQQQAVITTMTPKAEFVERFVEAEGFYNFHEAAKALGCRPQKFCDWLRGKYCFPKGELTPYAEYLDRTRLFVSRNYTAANGHAGVRYFVTPKGIEFFSTRVPTDIRLPNNKPRTALSAAATAH